ncbi:MAG TPA: DUF4019 domain-containing protein [Spirochaetota bacterium]|nr:DUF4019 domain-containing protein [Spirochaetota bacterium]HPC42592.1 DUF4019 domain-containing protein [Spirochaetota bacterium]HPL18368.1 DUF4019 domain-containing protein [Spirochaetota bacterium]HQF08388.1 DUF4019 domain-containing protein [Spirochaetota bacterium]HQH99024.1 DUF4019 domain-containing protein [Spirochaetota bacterium]
MKSITRAFGAIMIIATIIAAPACRKGDFSKQEKEAVAIATGWVHLIDDKKYAQSWDESAGIFRNAASRDTWVRTMTSTRKPFGETITRTLDSRVYMTSLPGAPDGEYVVIAFRTAFRNRKQSIETVTPMKDTDGKWRVSGYYMK